MENKNLAVNSVVLHQKGEEIYLFALDAFTLLGITYVNPQGRDTPAEIQRLLNVNRIKKIAEFVKQPSSLIPNNIVLNLTDDVQIAKNADGNLATITFPSKDGQFGYILDGQHRLKSFEYSEGINFDLAVVAFKNLDSKKAGKVFVDINTNQKPADKSLIFNIREAIGDLPDAEERAAAIVYDLDENNSSPLFEKVKRFEDDRRKWINSASLITWVKRIVDFGGTLQSQKRSDQTQILINYFSAFKELFPYTFSSRKDYFLWKPSGIFVMLELFPNVYQRVVFAKGKDFSTSNFKEAIVPIKNFTIEGSVPWDRENYAAYTSGAGRTLLIRKLMIELPPE